MSTSSSGKSPSRASSNPEVQTYSGHTYAERPVSFSWDGAQHRVAEIEKSWQEPEQRCFQVRTDENKIFRLCYNTIHNQWTITEVVRG